MFRPECFKWELPDRHLTHSLEFALLDPTEAEIRKNGKVVNKIRLLRGQTATDKIPLKSCVAQIHTKWTGATSKHYLTVAIKRNEKEEEIITFAEHKQRHQRDFNVWEPVINGTPEKIVLDTNSLTLYDSKGTEVAQPHRGFYDNKDGSFSVFSFCGKQFCMEVQQREVQRVIKLQHILYDLRTGGEIPKERLDPHDLIYFKEW